MDLDSHKSKEATKSKNLNVRFDNETYEKLQNISDLLGISLSTMVRLVIYERLEEYKKTENPKSVLDKIEIISSDVKSKNLAVKFTQENYELFEEVAEKIGTSVSNIVRLLVNNRLKAYQKSKDPRVFIYSSNK